VAIVVASTFVAASAALQVGIATKVESGVTRQRASAERAGLRVGAFAARQPCHVHSEVSFPMVGYAAGCRAAPLGKALGSWRERARHLEGDGLRPFLVLYRPEEPALPDGASLLEVVPSAGDASWFIYGPG
jgi:hypothetical protein